MKKFLIALTIFIVWSVIGLGLYSWLMSGSPSDENDRNKISENSKNGIVEKNLIEGIENTDTAQLLINDSTETKADIIKEIAIEDYELIVHSKNGEVILKLLEGIIITKNSSSLIIPDTSKEFAKELRSFMIENEDTEVHISSLYSAYERNETPNLGIQRGNELKEILAKNGISKDRVLVKSYIKPIEFSAENTFSRSFSFQLMSLDTSRIRRLNNPDLQQRIIYPKFTTTGIASNQNLKLFLKDVKIILAENEDVIIELIGHTDNVGNASDNYLLGLQYARQVKWYLINRGGISAKNIKARSKGESEPIDTNNNERSRNLNRRIEANFIKINDQRS